VLGGGTVTLRSLNPSLSSPIHAPRAVLDAISKSLGAFLPSAARDALGVLYRDQPLAYAERFLAEQAPRIDAYVAEQFGSSGPRYLVNSGIGANEQFNYFVAALANARPERRTTWLLANSPKEIAICRRTRPRQHVCSWSSRGAGSRRRPSSLHELTPRTARRIVFANSGPLRHWRARREPGAGTAHEVSGATAGTRRRSAGPMHVVGLDVRSYWSMIQSACEQMQIGSDASGPVVLAQYIRINSFAGRHHIYSERTTRCCGSRRTSSANTGTRHQS
jgi:hypothetical protein